MSSKKTFEIEQEKNFLVLMNNGSPIFKVTRDFSALADFLGGLSNQYEFTVKKKTKKKKKKKDKKEPWPKEVISKANQFEKFYRKAWKKNYKTKRAKEIKPASPEFEHFLKAAEIMKRHKTKIKVFWEAQVKGLQFVNNGSGVFPRITQISTFAAEQRLLEHLNFLKLESVELTDQERATELLQNRKYVKLHRKVKANDATLLEALYVRECQLARRGKTQGMVEDYIKQLKK